MQPQTLTTTQSTPLKTIQQFIKNNPNTTAADLTPEILTHYKIDHIPSPTLLHIYHTRLELDEARKRLLEIDCILRGDTTARDKAGEVSIGKVNGLVYLVERGSEPLTDWEGKISAG